MLRDDARSFYNSGAMRLHEWSSIELEQLTPLSSRKVVHSERITISRLFLKAGAVVSEHHHENEQLTMLISGKLKFLMEGKEIIVTAGQVLQIPPNVPHRVEVLEDSEATDLFAPIREDWLRGEDAYLRGESHR